MLPLVSIFVVVVGAMSGGLATPTDRRRSARLHHGARARLPRAQPAGLMKALRGTVGISGMILFIIVGATTFSQILSFSGATRGLVSAIFSQGFRPSRSSPA